MEQLTTYVSTTELSLTAMVASLRPQNPDRNVNLSDSQMSSAADQTRILISNCAIASWLLSNLNRELHVHSVRRCRRAAFWELYNNSGDLKDVCGVQRSTLLKLLRDLKPRLLPTEASQYGRPKHALELRVACGLHYLARGTTYSTCMGVFGIGKSTAYKYVRAFLIAVKKTYPHAIKMPANVTLDTMVQRTMGMFQRFREAAV